MPCVTHHAIQPHVLIIMVFHHRLNYIKGIVKVFGLNLGLYFDSTKYWYYGHTDDLTNNY